MEGEFSRARDFDFSVSTFLALQVTDVEEESGSSQSVFASRGVCFVRLRGREHRGLEALADSVCDCAAVFENRRWEAVLGVCVWAEQSACEGNVGYDSVSDSVWA